MTAMLPFLAILLYDSTAKEPGDTGDQGSGGTQGSV